MGDVAVWRVSRGGEKTRWFVVSSCGRRQESKYTGDGWVSFMCWRIQRLVVLRSALLHGIGVLDASSVVSDVGVVEVLLTVVRLD